MADQLADRTVVGIDIGGSKTRAIAVRAGRVLGNAQADSANLQSVAEEDATTVFAEIFSQLHCGDVATVSVGSAGLDSAKGSERLIRLLRPLVPHAEITAVHDTQLILAASGLSEGIALIAGTGSVAWGKRADGTTARVGGWGYLLGDEGSGYGIARSAVRHILSRVDKGYPADALSLRFASECGVTEPALLLDHFYTRTQRQYWAQLSGAVFELAASGDPAAKAITAQAATDLVTLINGICRRLGPGLPVILAGGLLTSHPSLVADVVRQSLAIHIANITVLQREPVYGALALAGIDIEQLERQ